MQLLLLLPLLLMIISDFRYRYVFFWHLLLFGLVQVGVCIYSFGLLFTGWNLLINTIILLFMGLFLKMYLFFFKKKEKGVGWGDVVFVFLLTPYFTCFFFLYFLIVSFSLTLLFWLIYNYSRYRKIENDKIPLISGVGICYLIVLVSSKMDILCL